jgi:hypothetical protein
MQFNYTNLQQTFIEHSITRALCTRGRTLNKGMRGAAQTANKWSGWCYEGTDLDKMVWHSRVRWVV